MAQRSPKQIAFLRHMGHDSARPSAVNKFHSQDDALTQFANQQSSMAHPNSPPDYPVQGSSPGKTVMHAMRRKRGGFRL